MTVVTSAGMAAVLGGLRQGDTSALIGGDPRECAPVLGVDGVAVSLTADERLTELVWGCAGTSTRLEDLQFTLGEGPGVDAVASRSLVLEPDLARGPADRWPALLPEALDLGVRAAFCFPLRVGDVCAGVLTLQRAAAGPLSSTAMDDALILAAALTAVVLDGGERFAAFAAAEPASHLHRAAVHQATGMISVQANVSLGQALLLLRAHAYRHERPVLQVAEDVVARRLHFRDDGNGPTPAVEKRG